MLALTYFLKCNERTDVTVNGRRQKIRRQVPPPDCHIVPLFHGTSRHRRTGGKEGPPHCWRSFKNVLLYILNKNWLPRVKYHFYLGSVYTRLAHHSSCPLLNFFSFFDVKSVSNLFMPLHPRLFSYFSSASLPPSFKRNSLCPHIRAFTATKCCLVYLLESYKCLGFVHPSASQSKRRTNTVRENNGEDGKGLMITSPLIEYSQSVI